MEKLAKMIAAENAENKNNFDKFRIAIDPLVEQNLLL